MTVIGPCRRCAGTGWLYHGRFRPEPCPECHGKGYQELGPIDGKSPEVVENERIEKNQ